jgi:hypothetical protein
VKTVNEFLLQARKKLACICYCGANEAENAAEQQAFTRFDRYVRAATDRHRRGAKVRLTTGWLRHAIFLF